MDAATTALVLVGFQNEFFAPEGLLCGDIEDDGSVRSVVENAIDLLAHLVNTPILVVSTPISFTPEYAELVDPVGVLAKIKSARAFGAGTFGAGRVSQLDAFRDQIVELPGKRGLNAFLNTDLDDVLRARGIVDVALAGALTSVCIDSTARSAHERGYRVTIVSDCTLDRTPFGHRFFCEQVFPLYTKVLSRTELYDILTRGWRQHVS